MPVGESKGMTAGKIKVREIKETSMTARSKEAGKSAGMARRALYFSRTMTRGSLRIFQSS